MTECQNLLFNNFGLLFCFSMRFVALEAHQLGLANLSTILSLCFLFVSVGEVYHKNDLFDASLVC